MLEVSEAVGAFKQTVCCIVGQHDTAIVCVVRQRDTCFSVTTERNSLGVTSFRIEISCGLCEYSTGLCEHGTVSVADCVSTVLVFVNTVMEQWWTL